MYAESNKNVSMSERLVTIVQALILQAITPCKNLEVWPRETIVLRESFV